MISKHLQILGSLRIGSVSTILFYTTTNRKVFGLGRGYRSFFLLETSTAGYSTGRIILGVASIIILKFFLLHSEVR